MALYARLDKSGQRVLCGILACPEQIARVSGDGVWPVELGEGAMVGPGQRELLMPPGWWRGDDGVWALTGRALRKRRIAERAGCPPGKAVWKVMPTRQEEGGGSFRYGLVVWDLPLEARCPRCRNRQVLDPVRLVVYGRALSPAGGGPPYQLRAYEQVSELPWLRGASRSAKMGAN